MRDPQKELEEFAYIVSHDLNAPLRHIKSFSNLLVKKIDDKLNDQEREYLQYMQGGVDQIEKLLSILLRYSRLNTEAENFREFDCNNLVQNIITESQDKIRESHASVRVSNLPTNLYGDKKQMRMVFESLLDNALKFRRSDVSPFIEIFAEEHEQQWLFSIMDNGVGIAEAQYEHVFKMFKRLDPSHYPGAGFGLTLSKKIIERHNGKIWIASDGESQTTIQMTVMKNPT